MSDFAGYTPTWCPGCGDWGIAVALKTSLTQMGFTPSQIAIVFGIGCSGNMNDFINAYAMHGLHGRAIPNAIGIKLANHKLPVIVVAGDGDCYGEGGNHFIHACRGNHNITVIVHDNGVYGLTTGQVSPRAQKGMKSKSTPLGIIETPVNPLSLAITQGAGFVAQGFAGNIPHLIDLIKKGISYNGFSLINVLQPCVTFNKINTFEYYLKRVYEVEDDPSRDLVKSIEVVNKQFTEEKYPLGIIYQNNRKPYNEELSQLSDITLVEKSRFKDMNRLLEQYI